ncbi:MAG: FkbM family methyltransferase [Acidobacteriota bacterium]|nr:FkbM family methyltransferase [Acidobacteriota bacterium]
MTTEGTAAIASGVSGNIAKKSGKPFSARAYHSGRAVADLLGLRRTAAGRKALAALNILGRWAAERFLLARRAPVESDGHRLHLAGERAPSLSLATALVEGGYERATRELIEGLLPEGGTFLDVGAHAGFYSLAAARRVGPRGRVFAFEPDMDNFHLLRKNIAENAYDNITAIPAAVCNRTGRAELFVSPQGNDRHSLFRNPGSPIEENAEEVDTTTLDDFAGALGWPAIDLIKMDIEGAEPLALAGMRRLLERSSQIRLIVEFSPGMLEAGGTAPQQFLEELARQRLEVRVIEDDSSPVPISPAHFAELAEKVRERGVVNLLCVKSHAAKAACARVRLVKQKESR